MAEEKNPDQGVEIEEGTMAEVSEQRRIRREKLVALKEGGNDPFSILRFSKTHDSQRVREDVSLMDQEVAVAGRILSRRVMGKASFLHILDGEGELQIYLRRDDVGEESYAAFRTMDLGDIIGVTGRVFMTRTGEVSVHANEIVLLSKSLIPPPEKFHGLRDPDLRYRQRYADLIANPEIRTLFKTRALVLRSMRGYLDDLGFMEVETPILQTEAAGATAKPFITHHNTLHLDMYLRIATELHLKRLIVGGFEKVYEIGRIFRNEGMDTRHNPEFTTIELYAAYWDMYDIMRLCENLIRHIAKEALGTFVVEYGDSKIDLEQPFRVASMAELVQEKTGINFYHLDEGSAYQEAEKAGFRDMKQGLSKGQLLALGFEQFVEETIIAPTFVTEYPIEISPFAKRIPHLEGMTYRFELFAAGRELANAFSELNDPIDQHERFLQQARERDGGDEEANMMDEDFVLALEYGMPPTGGIGMGIERLLMFLCGINGIRDVMLFPTMKPRENG